MTNTAPDAPYALARFRDGDEVKLGVVVGERLREITPEQLGAATLNDFLGAADWSRVEQLSAGGEGWRPLNDVVLTSPVEPGQVLQAGANYRTHVIQLISAGLSKQPDQSPEKARALAEKIVDKRAASGRPFIFLGLPRCVVGDDVDLVLPAGQTTHDWELELAVVIGAPGYKISVDNALDHVGGYTIVNDITTREFVFPDDVGDIGADWFRSKNAPGFLPTGPYLVPPTAIDPTDARVRLDLNGETMQDASTSELMFSVAQLISTASATIPLAPGDLLLTGSPAGNGQHWGRFLRDGDVMSGSIAGIGTQTVRCVDEKVAK